MNLTENSSKEQLNEFLLFHMASADNRQSNVNPSLTKEQSWNVIMGGCLKGSVRVHNILIKHAIKEFGSYYEGGDLVDQQTN